MKHGFYFRLAVDGIRKNSRLYIPYLLTCILMTAVYYILTFLSVTEVLDHMSGGSSTRLVLSLGSFVIAIFSVLFLFYTNSFLIRRRNREYGLYNVLGMNRRNLTVILFCETVITFMVSTLCGIIIGIALSKLSELALVNLVQGTVDYGFRIPIKVIFSTFGWFALIFLIIFFISALRLRRSTAISLVKSEHSGEKPPRGNAVLGFLGIVILLGAYVLAVSIKEPLAALIFFFAAVIAVIIASYLIFISGSVVMCRLLQKNKSYYYRAKNFVSVSSMAYRMKRNGAGLASICILLTMVLVMISSSACLFFGKDAAITSKYPKDICAFASWYGYSDSNKSLSEELTENVEEYLDASLVKPGTTWSYFDYCITGLNRKGNVSIELNSQTDFAFVNYNDIVEVHFIGIDDYNRMHGKNEILSDGEAIVCAVKTSVPMDFKVGDLQLHTVKRIDENALDFDGASLNSVTAQAFVIVNDVEPYAKDLAKYTDYNGSPMLLLRWYYEFDTTAAPEDQPAIARGLEAAIGSRLSFSDDIDSLNLYVNARGEQKADFYGTFGGLFFIGILLSTVFLLSAALIIYYKQVSEGYEDRNRFSIMQKVGMTAGNIRSSINAQMLTVFLLPIIFAVMHLCFAFPFVYRILQLFGIFNLSLLIITTAISIAVCAVIYIVIYRLTSHVYFSIVTDTEAA